LIASDEACRVVCGMRVNAVLDDLRVKLLTLVVDMVKAISVDKQAIGIVLDGHVRIKCHAEKNDSIIP